jgi:hypothetical protein
MTHNHDPTNANLTSTDSCKVNTNLDNNGANAMHAANMTPTENNG